MRNEDAKKEDMLIVTVPGQLASQHRGSCPVELLAAQPRARSKMSFMNHTYYWGQKPKGRRRGGKKKKSTILLLFDYRTFAKELISTSAKPLENTNSGFSHSFLSSRGLLELKAPRNKRRDQS